MNWFQRIAQENPFGDVSEWKDGQLAILSSFSWRDFSVVEVLSWENVSLLSDKYDDVDENTIKTTRGGGYSWRRDEAVPFKILDTYSDAQSGASRYHKPGEIRLAGPQNLYHSLEQLVTKESRSSYPDLVMELYQKPHIASLSKDFPELMGNYSVSDNIDYQIFDINGYEVQVINDKKAIEQSPSMMQTRGTEGMFYWNIPSLQTRSFDDKEGIDKTPWGSGRYPTMQRAMEAAEQYINHLFYSVS